MAIFSHFKEYWDSTTTIQIPLPSKSFYIHHLNQPHKKRDSCCHILLLFVTTTNSDRYWSSETTDFRGPWRLRKQRLCHVYWLCPSSLDYTPCVCGSIKRRSGLRGGATWCRSWWALMPQRRSQHGGLNQDLVLPSIRRDQRNETDSSRH